MGSSRETFTPLLLFYPQGDVDDDLEDGDIFLTELGIEKMYYVVYYHAHW